MSESVLVQERAPFASPRAVLRQNERLRRAIVGLLTLVAVVVAWEAAKAAFALPDYKLPHTYTILNAFFTPTPKGPVYRVLAGDALVTWVEAFAGFVLGGAAGFLLAVLFMRSALLERGLLPWVIASQTVPILAIAPMVVVGVGQLGAPSWLPKAIIAAYLTFFPVTINALRGLTSVEPDALALMHSYAAHENQTFFLLRLPASVPYLFTALKISATASVIGAIVAELPVGSSQGIGVEIVYGAQYNTFNPGFLWATILTAALLGLVFYGLVSLAEKWLVRWKRPET